MLRLLFELHVITAAAACLWYVSHDKTKLCVLRLIYKLLREQREQLTRE